MVVRLVASVLPENLLKGQVWGSAPVLQKQTLFSGRGQQSVFNKSSAGFSACSSWKSTALWKGEPLKNLNLSRDSVRF